MFSEIPKVSTWIGAAVIFGATLLIAGGTRFCVVIKRICNDCKQDLQGQELLDHPSIVGSPDLQSWIRDRWEGVEKILEKYSGKQLEAGEEVIWML